MYCIIKMYFLRKACFFDMEKDVGKRQPEAPPLRWRAFVSDGEGFSFLSEK